MYFIVLAAKAMTWGGREEQTPSPHPFHFAKDRQRIQDWVPPLFLLAGEGGIQLAEVISEDQCMFIHVPQQFFFFNRKGFIKWTDFV